jgi:hypothetical protein
LSDSQGAFVLTCPPGGHLFPDRGQVHLPGRPYPTAAPVTGVGRKGADPPDDEVVDNLTVTLTTDPRSAGECHEQGDLVEFAQ